MSALKKTRPSDNLQDLGARFVELAEKMTAITGREGLEIAPYRDPTLPFFSKLPTEYQQASLGQLETLVTIAERVQTRGENVSRSQVLIWAFLSHMGLTGPSDLQQYISDDSDVIDIYNTNHQLIFANLTYFRYCSYSLEDVYARPWYDLFARDQEAAEQSTLKISQEMIDGKHHGVIDLSHLPKQIIIEKEAKTLRRGEIVPRVCAPLYQYGQVVACIWINKFRMLSDKS